MFGREPHGRMGSEKSFYAFRQEQAKKFQVDKEWAEADSREIVQHFLCC